MALQMRGLILLVWIGLSLSATPGFAQQNSDPPLSDVLDKLDRYVNQAMGKTKVPGVSVAVVYKDQVVFLKGYGVRTVS